MLYVVGIAPGIGTAGEATSAIPGDQGPADRRRNRAPLAPDIDRPSPIIFEAGHDPAIAQQALGGFCGNSMTFRGCGPPR